ncbi:unnamed protein product [Lasius platythorax]|uniref:BED-type domain-containing protein n=1 Tax=Lasius platythorax TaxID=488582 RepID=A0AAV2MXH8_9HYME
MSRCGRPTHNFWENDDFERRSVGGKMVAYCMVCEKTLTNSSKSRLQTHRATCNREKHRLTASKSKDINGNMFDAIHIGTIASSSDPRTSKIIAIAVQNAEHVPVIVSDREISTVLSQGLSADVSSTFVLPCAKKHKTSKSQKRGLDPYFDYVLEKDKIRFDESVAKFVHGCNIPFDKVESKVFLDCMRTIRPGYKPLSAAAIAN